MLRISIRTIFSLNLVLFATPTLSMEQKDETSLDRNLFNPLFEVKFTTVKNDLEGYLPASEFIRFQNTCPSENDFWQKITTYDHWTCKIYADYLYRQGLQFYGTPMNFPQSFNHTINSYYTAGSTPEERQFYEIKAKYSRIGFRPIGNRNNIEKGSGKSSAYQYLKDEDLRTLLNILNSGKITPKLAYRIHVLIASKALPKIRYIPSWYDFLKNSQFYYHFALKHLDNEQHRRRQDLYYDAAPTKKLHVSERLALLKKYDDSPGNIFERMEIVQSSMSQLSALVVLSAHSTQEYFNPRQLLKICFTNYLHNLSIQDWQSQDLEKSFEFMFNQAISLTQTYLTSNPKTRDEYQALLTQKLILRLTLMIKRFHHNFSYYDNFYHHKKIGHHHVKKWWDSLAHHHLFTTYKYAMAHDDDRNPFFPYDQNKTRHILTELEPLVFAKGDVNLYARLMQYMKDQAEIEGVDDKSLVLTEIQSSYMHMYEKYIDLLKKKNLTMSEPENNLYTLRYLQFKHLSEKH